MDEHQNTQDTYAQPDGAGSGNGAATVLRAGGESAASARDLPGDTSSGNSAGVFREAAEASETVLRAGQQTLHRAEAAMERSEAADGANALDALTSCARRTALRNVRAMGDLLHCRTLPSLMQWQSDLLTSTLVDWAATNARIFTLETRKA